MATIVVTGASGFVGSHVVPALIDAGHRVVGVTRNEGKAAIVEGDGSSSHFYPGAYASYSVTSQFALGATVERDFPGDLTIGRAGLRFGSCPRAAAR